MAADVEYGLSTSILQRDLDRLPLLGRFPATHVEIGFYPEDRLDVVLAYVDKLGLSYGFHDPLPWHPRWQWPSLTDPDASEQARSLGVMAHTLETASRHNARYALTHFPSVHFEPVERWSRERALEAGHEVAATLARWADERGVPILLENVGPNPYWDAAAWQEIFRTYAPLSFCLDVGHLHLDTGGQRDENRAFVDALAPFTRQVHVYNATREAYQAFHHVPAHPEQRPDDGWIDLPELLGIVVERRAGPVRFIFEHTPQYPVDEDYVRAGMDWIREITGGRSADPAPRAPR
jgi:sugar phosphate isomerase/epimerase